MLKAKEFRQTAWGKLRGKWGQMALSTFIYSLIMGACSALAYIYVGTVALLLLSGPMTLGLTLLALNAARGEDVSVNRLFDGFKNFGSAVWLHISNGLLIFLWTLLLIVPGIIKTFSYALSFHVLKDHPELSANEARKRSMVLMSGNKWRLFCLRFSFIGWWLLCLLTLGILSFWITPYQNTAIAEFYISLLPAEEKAETPAVLAEPFEEHKEEQE
ncbi:MAG: DUF975 family protein [Clostridia bacterium]|nr:DUF975 family protein [Clostridia bacterium]